MADKVHFDLVSPERALMSAEADMVVVPGAEGNFGVLADHAPFMSTLRPGVIEVHDQGSDQINIYISGGFAEVTPKGLTILAEEAIPLDEVEPADIEARVRDAEEDVRIASSDEERERMEQTLGDLRLLAEAFSDYRRQMPR